MRSQLSTFALGNWGQVVWLGTTHKKHHWFFDLRDYIYLVSSYLNLNMYVVSSDLTWEEEHCSLLIHGHRETAPVCLSKTEKNCHYLTGR